MRPTLPDTTTTENRIDRRAEEMPSSALSATIHQVFLSPARPQVCEGETIDDYHRLYAQERTVSTAPHVGCEGQFGFFLKVQLNTRLL